MGIESRMVRPCENHRLRLVVLFFGRIMRKVICFIDGFNLYHAIDNLNQNQLKWLDLRKLALRFVKKNSCT